MNQKEKSSERLTISIPKSQYELIENLSCEQGVSKSKIIRDAIQYFLDKDQPLFEGLHNGTRD